MYTIQKLLEKGNAQNSGKVVDLSHEESGHHEWSYNEICKETERISKYILQIVNKLSPKKQHVIAYSFHNSIELIILFLAICRANQIALPLNFMYKAAEHEFYLSDVDASVVIINDSSYLNPEEIKKATDHLNESQKNSCKNNKIMIATMKFNKYEKLFNIVCDDTPLALDSNICINEAEPNSLCLILHTSGTTSRPKAVPLTQNNIATTMQNITNAYELTSSDSTVLVMPLFHIHGIVGGFLSPLSVGSQIVIPKGGKFSAQAFWKDGQKYKISWLTAVPTILQILLSRASKEYPNDKSVQLRFIRSSSSPLAIQTLEAVEQTFETTVLEAYSMTEASHQMTTNPLKGPHKRKPGTVGMPCGVEICIFDFNGNVLPPGEIGEVCIKGANVTSGYLNNPEANVEAFKYGYFHTGDLGCFDEDHFLTIKGRIKEMINRGGEKINPSEIDSVLLKNPAIKEAAAFSGPDPKYGECVCCAVVYNSKEEALSNEQLQNFCKEFLAEFKIPVRIFVTDELPRTATGKVQRRHVASHFIH